MARRLDSSALRSVAIAALLLIAPAVALAHPALEAHAEIGWTFEPWVVACLAVSASLYAAGLMRMWRKAGRGNGITRMQGAGFCAGLIALTGALVSPLDALGGYL